MRDAVVKALEQCGMSQILHQGVYVGTNKLQIEGRLIDKAIVESSIPVLREFASLK